MFEPSTLLNRLTDGLAAHRERATGRGLRGLHGGALANSHAIIPCMYSAQQVETIRAYCKIQGREATADDLEWCRAHADIGEAAAMIPVLETVLAEWDK